MQPAGSEATFRLTIPPEGTLEFGVRGPLDTLAQETAALRHQLLLRRASNAEDIFFSEPSERGETRVR